MILFGSIPTPGVSPVGNPLSPHVAAETSEHLPANVGLAIGAVGQARTVSIPLAGNPKGIAYDPWDGNIYVAVGGEEQVISPVTDSVIQTWPGYLAFNYGLSSGGYPGWMYVVEEDPSMAPVVLDVNTTTSGQDWNVPLNSTGAPTAVAYDPVNRYLYVNDETLGLVYLVNDTDGVIAVSFVATHGPTYAFAYVPSLGEMYVGLDGNLKAISDTTESVVHNVSFGGVFALGTMGLAYAPSSGLLYVTGTGGSPSNSGQSYYNVTEIDPTTNSVVGHAVVGPDPSAALYDPFDRSIYTANYRGGNVSVLNTTTNAVSATVAVGKDPYALAYDPTNGEVFVSNSASANVTVIVPSTPLPLTATASASSSSGKAPLTTWLNATAGGGVPPYSYAWNFGDGTRGTGPSNQKTYSTVGTYGVVLWVNDSAGSTVVKWLNITVSASGPVHFTVNFSVHPVSCAITFNGTSQVSGSSGSYLAGTYTANAPRCGPDWAFQQWNASGGVSVSTPTAWSPTVTISANGSLIAYYIWVGPVPVTFHISPSRCGTIAINGSTQADGTTASLYIGGYSISVNPCSYYVFQQWNSTGGVSVVIPNAAASSITLSAPGSLTAWFVWSGRGIVPRYHVTFYDSPAGCPMNFNGTSQANQTSAMFPLGNYTAAAPACSGYALYGWVSRFVGPGGTFNGGSATNPTLVDILGNGTVNVTYLRAPVPTPRYVLSFVASPSVCGPVIFNGTSQANATFRSFLAGTYTADAVACAGHPFSGWTLRDDRGAVQRGTPSPWANISVAANGTLYANYTATSLAPLVVSLGANATSAVAGSPVTLTPSVSGGLSPYSCAWSLNATNTSQAGCTAATMSWPHPGTYAYRVWATDSTSSVGGSNTLAITVSPRSGGGPSPLVAFANGTVASDFQCASDGGVYGAWTENLSGNARGGAPPYTFAWAFGDSSMGGVGRNLTHPYTSPGTYTASLLVTDVHGRQAWANVTVGVALPSCHPPTQGFSVLGLSPLVVLTLLAGLGAGLLAIIAFVLVRHRRRGPSTAPTPTDPPTPDTEGPKGP